MSRLAPMAALVWALLVPTLASASAGVGSGTHDWAIYSGEQVRFQAQGQDRLDFGGANVETVSHERATSIRRDYTSSELVAAFEDAGSRTELRIHIDDRIKCTWATLSTG